MNHAQRTRMIELDQVARAAQEAGKCLYDAGYRKQVAQ